MNPLIRPIVKIIDKELHKPKKGDGKTVYLPPLLLIIGIVCTAVLLIPAFFGFFIMKSIGGGVAFLAMALLSSSMIIGYFNQRIYYDESGFVSKTFFGNKREFLYSDIEYISGRFEKDTKIIAKGKKIHLDEIAIGKIEFIAFAEKQYQKTNCGKSIPKKNKTSKFDFVFKGNVRNPGAPIFVYAFITVLWLVVIAFVLFYNQPTEMDSLEFKTVTVQSYRIKGDEIQLDIDGFETRPYLRGYEQTIADYNGFISLLNNKSEFEIGYETFVDDRVTKYRIEYVKDKNGTVYTTPEDYYRFYQSERKILAVFILCLVIVWLLYVGFVIYVGRNPRKFKPEFVHKFFKKGDIKF
ncbi:MAG: hypothetical protein IIX16_10980 [Clostridia bacterium]|nr:hypothetical protein [Clostridia bacterium]